MPAPTLQASPEAYRHMRRHFLLLARDMGRLIAESKQLGRDFDSHLGARRAFRTAARQMKHHFPMVHSWIEVAA